MNQTDYTDEEHERLKKERFLGDTDVESRLNYNIRKVETDLKEDIQKVETDLKEDIQKVETDLKENVQKIETALEKDIQRVMDSHKRLVSRLWWIVGIGIPSVVAIVVALITKGN
ncbi:hypothetical protein F4054_20010 [Candidatus Poribacteria bacterium]|nr:hypothetical protein [Gammaproteobacteria bacterium]MYK24533.1 hypothetical protein [Candidatus Poribacteria bacterium]